MQPIKLSKILVPCAVVASVFSMNANATSTTYTAGFTTVPEITLVQVTPMSFGTGMLGGLNKICSMTVTGSGATYAGDVAMKLGTGATVAAGGTYPLMGGSGCSTPGIVGVPGVYRITGVPGGAVKVTANSVAGTNFTFAPAGCVANYNAAPDGDVCTALPANTLTNANVANTADTIGNTAGGLPISGQALIALGGSLTSAIAFLPGTTYTETFVIDVTY